MMGFRNPENLAPRDLAAHRIHRARPTFKAEKLGWEINRLAAVFLTYVAVFMAGGFVVGAATGVWGWFDPLVIVAPTLFAISFGTRIAYKRWSEWDERNDNHE